MGNKIGGNQSETYELILYIMYTHILELNIPVLISESHKDVVYIDTSSLKLILT